MRLYVWLFTILTCMTLSFSACSREADTAITAYVTLTPSPTAALPPQTPVPSVTPTPTPTPKPVSISVGGDVMFDTFVADKIDQMGINSYTEDISPIFSRADISMVNLETAISTGGVKETDKQFTFRADPKYLQLLTHSGIGLVSLANNYTLDFGITALEDTFSSLSKNNILFAGAGKNMEDASKPIILNKNNSKIAILASSHVIPVVSWNASSNKSGLATTYDPSRIISEIKKARETADIVMCYIHWGEEGATAPVEYQRNLARSYIDNGADIVVGSHPHVLQGFEYYKNRVIMYSLGNLIFTDMHKKTAIVNFTVNSSKGINVKVYPFEINTFKPVLIKNQESAESFYRELESISYGVKIDSNGCVSPKS